MIRVCFADILMTSSSDPISQYCGSVILDSRLEYESLESLIEFSVSGSKVMPKKIQIFQEFPRAFRGFP